jgi:hypothetical protein
VGQAQTASIAMQRENCFFFHGKGIPTCSVSEFNILDLYSYYMLTVYDGYAIELTLLMSIVIVYKTNTDKKKGNAAFLTLNTMMCVYPILF